MEQEQRHRLDRILGRAVSFDAIALDRRWWQFERWLRDRAIVQLRARCGPEWALDLRCPAPNLRSRVSLSLREVPTHNHDRRQYHECVGFGEADRVLGLGT